LLEGGIVKPSRHVIHLFGLYQKKRTQKVLNFGEWLDFRALNK